MELKTKLALAFTAGAAGYTITEIMTRWFNITHAIIHVMAWMLVALAITEILTYTVKEDEDGN